MGGTSGRHMSFSQSPYITYPSLPGVGDPTGTREAYDRDPERKTWYLVRSA